MRDDERPQTSPFYSFRRCLEGERRQEEMKRFHIYQGDDDKRSLITEEVSHCCKAGGKFVTMSGVKRQSLLVTLKFGCSNLKSSKDFVFLFFCSLSFFAHIVQGTYQAPSDLEVAQLYVALCEGGLIHRCVFSQLKGTHFFRFCVADKVKLPSPHRSLFFQISYGFQ